jgi:hypothetical protein
MWLTFLQDYNGVTFFRDLRWTNTNQLSLYSDAAKWVMGLYFEGRWSFSQWGQNSKYTTSIQLMEIFPIAVSLSIWGHCLQNKKVIFHCDNLSVVQCLNNQSSKCPKIMAVKSFIVLKSLQHNILMRSVHIVGTQNIYCDQLSRGQIKEFKAGCPHAREVSDLIPLSIWLI